VTPARWAALAALAFALYFAVQGGEYGTLDLIHLRTEEQLERSKVLRLRSVVDSLTRAAAAIEHDPRVQERAAREQFGMIRRGELLYRIVPADSGIGR
jgi:cell division protein FtsB